MQSSARRIPANGLCIAADICETVQCFDCDSVYKVAGVSLNLRCFTYTFHAHLIRSIAYCSIVATLTVSDKT